MGRVLTNFTGMRAVRETSLGVAPTTASTWFAVEFESIGAYGLEITTVARRPIGIGRGRRKGTVTDANSSVEFKTDLTLQALNDFIEGFFFAEFANVEFNLRTTGGILPPPAIAATDDFTIAAASALLAGKMVYDVAGAITLVYAKGYTNAANNGIFELAADVASTDTAVQVNGSLVDETPPTNATLQVCGVRVTQGDLTLSAPSGGVATLTSAGDIADWATLGIRAGMFIHIGGVNTATGAVINALNDSVADDTYGYARVTAVAGAVLTLDKLDENLDSAADHAADGVCDVLFGRWVRNVEVTDDADDTRFLEQSFQIELAYPNLGAAAATAYEYAVGNYPNELTINLPLTEKATMGMAFVGTTSDEITETRKTGPSSAVEPLRTTAFSTAIDIMALTTDVVSSASDVCFKSLTMTILNNASPEKCLGTLGARFVNIGQFEINFEGQMAFTAPAIVNAVRANTTVTFAAILRNDDGAFAFDMPELTLGGGGREFPVDETVLVNLTGASYTGDLGYDASVTIFPVVPFA